MVKANEFPHGVTSASETPTVTTTFDWLDDESKVPISLKAATLTQPRLPTRDDFYGKGGKQSAGYTDTGGTISGPGNIQNYLKYEGSATTCGYTVLQGAKIPFCQIVHCIPWFRHPRPQIVSLHRLLLWEGWLRQIGWFLGKDSKRGGWVIFNPKTDVADFRNFKQVFLSMKLIQKRNFRVQGMFFKQLYCIKIVLHLSLEIMCLHFILSGLHI